MFRILSFILLGFVYSACNENKEVKETTVDSTVNSGEKMPPENEGGMTSISGCYLRVLERDTLAASLQQDGNIITGKLTFDNYQKDGSTGTVNGKIGNGIVKLVYRFQSEGMNVFQKFSSG